ncbi:MBL fold metallo-hydrolase [Akkermansiaceae bacterium]|nr:MBL fold metallo-hydrolase [Akkermansiaceae bacterium]MDB4537213.1 MBL fold metallo-hydrolase [Akkermansiaceae bacterium]
MIRSLGSTHRAFLFRDYFAILDLMNDIIQLRGNLVHHHALIEGDCVHLLDGGFLGGIARIKSFLQSRDLDFTSIKNIIISHGHLDHTANIAHLQELSGCQVHAPERDRDLISGYHHYEGLNKIGGLLERLGANLTKHRIPQVDHWLQEGDTLNLLGGLEVIALPGHTPGHCGFLQRQRGLLFANDLFSNQIGRPKPPPRIFNDNHEEALASIIKAAELPIDSVFLNHEKKESPADTLFALKQLALSLPL